LALNNTENNRNKAKNQTSLLGLALPIYHILGIFFLRLPCKYDPVILHGLKSHVKYVRLVRRKRNGQNFFYAQLVCLGIPFQKPKNKVGNGIVGLDIGPSTIAMVGDESARLEQFASELEFPDKHLRKFQRRMERSRRANNPDNYNPNGTIKKGKKTWNNSQTYVKLRNAKANLERKLAAHRKSLHGQTVNSILSEGNIIKLEKLSYKAFQKIFGKSVGKRAPGMFVAHLKRKAESAGVKVVEFPTYNTRLSQTCQCGRVKKKKLSERVHQCECGIEAQRDLYSAFLARFVDPETNVLQVNQVLSAWESAELCLRAAWRTATINQPAIGGRLPSSFGRCPETERVAAEVSTKIPKSRDVVSASREPGKGYSAAQRSDGQNLMPDGMGSLSSYVPSFYPDGLAPSRASGPWQHRSSQLIGHRSQS